ncbi:hypothetical protein [Pararhodonellum marinum]|uniref:hypothetical protein n=1 Tax=Pararhodonellum marinum TaxID=2755358 RepID=UPI00188F00DC|nr:hypothetical protein [Pararhodonellum marinum]
MKKSLWVILLLALNLSACIESELPEQAYPRVETMEVNPSANLRGRIDFPSNQAISDHGFLYGTNELTLKYEGEKISLGTAQGSLDFTSPPPPQFAGGTTYYFRAFAKTETHTVFGNVVAYKLP